MIFAKDVSNEHEHLTSNIASDAQKEQEHFLQEYVDCFSETIPMEMPPSRGEDDHRIDLVPGTTPPNRPPYRVSRAQQKEIMNQVNELLEKGMVRPKILSFLLTSAISAKERWFIPNVCGLSCTQQEHY